MKRPTNSIPIDVAELVATSTLPALPQADFLGLFLRSILLVDTIPSVARWNLPSLNYRRGMQRIYLVLSVLWIGLVVSVSISERPIPVGRATKTQFGDPIDRPAEQPRVNALGDPISESSAPAGPPAAHPWDKDVVTEPSPKTNPTFEELARERSAHPSTASEPRQSVARYWETRSAWAFTPPVAGYLILFGVLPWIGRGFRSAQV
jgi:hypothetical protein